MADFNTAKHWLKQGKKVTRECWESHSYWKLGVDQIIFYSDGTKATVHINQIEARDWMIFEEDLSSKIELFRNGSHTIRAIPVGHFKDFIKKLREELYNDPEPCCHGVRERDFDRIIKEQIGSGLI